MIRDAIPEAMAGERIDRVVAMLCGCTRAEAHDAVAGGSVTIDDRVVTKPSVKVGAGQVVAVSEDPSRPPVLPWADPSVAVEVIHADDSIIVVDKPAGLVVHPGAGNPGGTLVNGLLALYPELAGVGEAHRPGIVHRLDKGTSGLMVVARTDAAYHDLVAQLSTHSVQRHYRALVWGRLETQRGTIDAPIGRSRRDPLRMTISAEGRPSRTHYEVVQQYDEPVSVTVPPSRWTGRSCTPPTSVSPIRRAGTRCRSTRPSHRTSSRCWDGSAERFGRLAGPDGLAPGDRRQVGQRPTVQQLAHLAADLVPDGQQHALALVVTGPVGVGLAEVACLDWAVHRADDLGQGDLRGVTGQDVPATHAPLGPHDPGALERQKDLLEVGLGQAGALGDVADRGRSGIAVEGE